MDMGKVKLSAVRSEEHLEIYLKPHSALATEVQIGAINSSTTNSALLEKIAAYVTGYIRGPGLWLNQILSVHLQVDSHCRG